MPEMRRIFASMKRNTIVIACFAVCVVGAVSLRALGGSRRGMSTSSLLEIKNSDIEWHGTYLGLVPTAKGASANALKRITAADLHSLVEMLGDEHRFVAAHFILTKWTKRNYRIDGEMWNGLGVRIDSRGQTSIVEAQR